MVSGGLEAREVKLQEEITPAVTVAAIDGAAAEVGAEAGTFRITRVASASVPLDEPLTVSFTFSGTAENGVDFDGLEGSITLAAGESSADVIIAPLGDSSNEDDETVILTLVDAGSGVIGTPNAATITIADAPVVVTVTAVDPNAAEAGVNTGIFQFVRSGSWDTALTITFELSGTASNGADFEVLPVTVTFPAGDTHTSLVVRPVADATVEGSESVILTIIEGDDYEIETPETSIATVNIAG